MPGGRTISTHTPSQAWLSSHKYVKSGVRFLIIKDKLKKDLWNRVYNSLMKTSIFYDMPNVTFDYIFADFFTEINVYTDS